jgi:SRSO17 transposase
VHYRTKNELARALVWKLVRRGLRGRFILFDNWYCSRRNLTLFERLELNWVTSVKANLKVWFDGQGLTVKQVAALVTKANYHYYRALSVRVRSYQVKWEGRLLKLTVIKDDRGPEGGRTKYLLTNDLTLTNQQHVRWYRRRWVIEVFFRDAKQEVGLATGEARTPEAVIAHVLLVCVATTFLQLLKPLQHDHHPSVRTSKDALAPLVVVLTLEGNWQIARPEPTGHFQCVSFDHLWHPVRTRLPGLSWPPTPVFP